MNHSQADCLFMQRCLDIAIRGNGNVAPNPMVGSVIVHNGKIIGEGFHQKYGEAHAEVNAVKSVKNKNLLEESTLYVNLEPCSHYGKTPPCSDLIIHHKIKRVVIGCIDSFSEVCGRGIDKMRTYGIEVTVGVLEKESRFLNRRFFTFHEKHRPYVILKWAQTQDGFIDIDHKKFKTKRGVWITNDTCRSLVHKWRTEECAILIGTDTALNDNPSLNVRSWVGNNPTRIVIDRTLRLPNNLTLFDGSQPTIVFTEIANQNALNIEYTTIDFDKNDFWSQIFENLYSRKIQSVIIEGGQKILNNIIATNNWNEAQIFVGNVSFGNGIKAPQIETIPTIFEMIGDSKLSIYYNKK